MDWLWDQLTQAEWAARHDAAGGALQQAWEYGAAMQGLGARVRRLVIREDGRDLALAQVLERPGLRLVSRGPVMLRAGCPRRILRGLARHRGATLATQALTGPGLLPLITARHHAEWDLTPATAALRAGLHGKWRNALRRGEGLMIREGGGAEMAVLARLDAAQGRARGYRNLPPGFLDLWPGERLVLHWSPGGRMQAGMVFLRHGRCATYHTGWTGPEGRAANAHRAMLWQAALHLRASGVQRLDLGEVSDAHPDLARFKLGTGARIVEVGATSLVLP